MKKDQSKQDLSWLMPYVDTEDVLDRLGVRISKKSHGGREIWGWCPDHHLFVYRDPSHPKWSINTVNGATFCFTEGRGSNLVYITSRMLNLPHDEAVEWILGNRQISSVEAKIAKLRSTIRRFMGTDDEEPIQKGDFGWIEEQIREGVIYKNGIDYLWHPKPRDKKKPTRIKVETAVQFGVFQQSFGYYRDRLIVPFYDKNGVIMGFEGVSVIPEDEWLVENPGRSYRKVLYPKTEDTGFERNKVIYGYSRVSRNADLFVTEGAREVVKLTQEGFQAVAILGSYFSDEQFLLICELSPKRIFVMMDGDDVGYALNRKVYNRLSTKFPDTFIVRCEDGFDPKNYDRDGVRQLLQDSCYQLKQGSVDKAGEVWSMIQKVKQ